MTPDPDLRQACARLLAVFGIPADPGGTLAVHTPIDGSLLGHWPRPADDAVANAVQRAQAAFAAWRTVPAPRRGLLVRAFADELRQHKQDLGCLLSLETGKILAEAEGEVQEMIDMADFAVGLSRQLAGQTLPSERPGHRLQEVWLPLGVVGVISAFNFPAAVWAWNALLAWVCGNPVIWKPASRTPLTAFACQALFLRAGRQLGYDQETLGGLSQVLAGDAECGRQLAAHPGIALLSATGSCALGRSLAPVVAARFGRCLLELGGNNGMIVGASADPELALRAITFAAAGTAGQRCTTLRRLFVHATLADGLLARLQQTWANLPVGHPWRPGTLVGPLIDAAAGAAHAQALADAAAEGGRVFAGERVFPEGGQGGVYVRPALVEMPEQTAVMQRETFSPILYVLRYENFAEALAAHNAVAQGLASSLISRDLHEVEQFLGPAGSDCGIANINVGPSGAEIGGAFGGEKASGGGREAGSDAWKAYMRRSTQTINASAELPLAQGIRFG